MKHIIIVTFTAMLLAGCGTVSEIYHDQTTTWVPMQCNTDCDKPPEPTFWDKAVDWGKDVGASKLMGGIL